MSVVSSLRKLRHGPLRWLGPVWTPLGSLYRKSLRALGSARPTSHHIGSYGPFLLHGEFAFSDFENWGGGHNRGFGMCIEACKDKKCVLDVGAHIGLVSLPMSRAVAKGGQVFAFEPAAANLAHLRDHLKLNKISNVHVEQSLVGAERKASVRFHEQSKAAGQNSVVVKKNPEAYRETQRPQVSLDGFCQEKGLEPEIIKIDVEGAEIEVLRGARNTLRKLGPTIFLSVHPVELGLLGSSPEELARLIDELGYDCRDIDGNEVTSFRLDEYVLTPQH